jgi:hypothetical protein
LPLGLSSEGAQSLQFREPVEEAETEGEETVPKKEVLGALGPVAQEVRDCQPLGNGCSRRLWDRRKSCVNKERLRVLDSPEEVAGGGEQLRRPDEGKNKRTRCSSNTQNCCGWGETGLVSNMNNSTVRLKCARQQGKASAQCSDCATAGDEEKLSFSLLPPKYSRRKRAPPNFSPPVSGTHLQLLRAAISLPGKERCVRSGHRIDHPHDRPEQKNRTQKTGVRNGFTAQSRRVEDKNERNSHDPLP